MDGLWMLLLEAGVALALLLFIVWWTMAARRADVTAMETTRSGDR